MAARRDSPPISSTRAAHPLGDAVIIGRSSSHFTRVTRIFAHELEVEHSFRVVPDLTSLDPDDYGGNPALKIPVLRTREGIRFGTLAICRQLARQAQVRRHVVWPEALAQAVAQNAQELVVQAMATEVTLIMARLADDQASGQSLHRAKLEKSLADSMSWLDANVVPALASLPPARDLSYLEVTLYCLVTHLEFRDVLPVAAYSALQQFRGELDELSSSRDTAYRFDT